MSSWVKSRKTPRWTKPRGLGRKWTFIWLTVSGGVGRERNSGSCLQGRSLFAGGLKGEPGAGGVRRILASAGIAGGALAPRGRERRGAALAVGVAIPLSYLTLAGQKAALRRIGQTRSGIVEDLVVAGLGVATVAGATRARRP